MKIINNKISLKELAEMSVKMFDGLVKAVVDIEKEIMAVDAELHVDEEALLLQNGSKQADLWGINIYPKFYRSENFIEFDSMINIRPSQSNRSRSVDNPEIRQKILKIINKLIIK